MDNNKKMDLKKIERLRNIKPPTETKILHQTLELQSKNKENIEDPFDRVLKSYLKLLILTKVPNFNDVKISDPVNITSGENQCIQCKSADKTWIYVCDNKSRELCTRCYNIMTHMTEMIDKYKDSLDKITPNNTQNYTSQYVKIINKNNKSSEKYRQLLVKKSALQKIASLKNNINDTKIQPSKNQHQPTIPKMTLDRLNKYVSQNKEPKLDKKHISIKPEIDTPFKNNGSLEIQKSTGGTIVDKNIRKSEMKKLIKKKKPEKITETTFEEAEKTRLEGIEKQRLKNKSIKSSNRYASMSNIKKQYTVSERYNVSENLDIDISQPPNYD